jgi:hypothetical protein
MSPIGGTEKVSADGIAHTRRKYGSGREEMAVDDGIQQDGDPDGDSDIVYF